MTEQFRCTRSSLERDEPVAGTASTFRAFLLVECPGPWGVDALPDCRMPAEVTTPLARRCRELKIRPLLIRRHGRSPGDGRRVFLAYADRRRPWVESTRAERPADLLDLDLDAAARGRSPGLVPHEDPLFLVCTQGRHDVCCAEQGRPAAAALSRAYPEHTWEVSHIGGDRFAGNMLVLPEGLYYGRLSPSAAVSVAKSHREGELSLDHLRGRSAYAFAVQAAEIYLRRETACTTNAAVVLRAQHRDGELTTATFDHEGRSWRVQVRTTMAEPTKLTCRAVRDSPFPRHELVALQPSP